MKVTVPHPDQLRDTDLIFFFFKVEQRAMIAKWLHEAKSCLKQQQACPLVTAEKAQVAPIH